jgi:P4 family phage/plasmid primase-like protien
VREYIQTYRSKGWQTIRVQPCGKAPIGAWQGRTDDPDSFRPGENVGVRLGDSSDGLVDVDLDCAEAVALAPLFLPPTATFGRPSKPKSHWLYRCAGIKTRKPGRVHVELRSTGGQTVFPPSLHETGEQIAWTDHASVSKIDGHDLLAAFGRLCAAVLVARVWPRLDGNKHDAVLAFAGVLHGAGWTEDDASDLLLPAMALDGSDAPHRAEAIAATWTDHDRNRYGMPALIKLIDSPDANAFETAIELVKPPPTGVSDTAQRPHTDAGTAERLMDAYGEDLKYVAGIGWMQYSGVIWVPSADPVELMIQCARKVQREAANAAETKFGLAMESSGRIRAGIAIAADLSTFRSEVDRLDSDPWLLNTPNGTVNLETGDLREHRRGDLITRCTNARYEPEATCPRFEAFLHEVLHEDVVPYALRYLGYSLTGSVREQVFQVWLGGGSNGKSVLVDTVRYILGSYAQMMAPDLLLERRSPRDSGSASPDVARLRGVRFAAGIETKEGQRWNESLVKMLTGSDRITARFLRREFFEFDPSWKLVLSVNHKPIVRGTDHGIWRRIHLVDFDRTFEGPAKDPELTSRLKGEAPGILALLVRSCLEWQAKGLEVPDRVAGAVNKYRAGQDVVGSFLRECCNEDATKRTPVARMYTAYRYWCQDSGEYCHGKHAFNNQLRERGYYETKAREWIGLDLVAR